MSAIRIVRSAALIASALAAATVATTVPASAATLPGGLSTIKSEATGRCLDSNGSGSAYALPCNGGYYQDWYVNAGGSDVWFQDQETGLNLTVDITFGSPEPVYTQSSDNLAIHFTPHSNSDGSWTFTSDTNGWCLDSNTNGKGNNVGAVYVLKCNGGAYQKFRLGFPA